MTTYAPKRIGYKHDAYVARMQLACLDHNAHVGRPHLKRKDGTLVYNWKLSKRYGPWCAIPVYERKKYEYVTGMCVFMCVDTSVLQICIYRHLHQHCSVIMHQ